MWDGQQWATHGIIRCVMFITWQPVQLSLVIMDRTFYCIDIALGVFVRSSFGVGNWVSCAFWELFDAQKCAYKVQFYKPCTLAGSEGEFHYATGILHLKSRHASLYSVKVITMSRLAIDCLLFWRPIHDLFRCCKTDCTTFLSFDMQNIERGQLWLTRNCVNPLCIFNGAWWRLNLLSVSDRNQTSLR